MKSGYGHSRTEAIRELELLSSGSEASLAALHILIEAHLACKMIDQDAIRDAKAKFSQEERRANAQSTKLLATVFWVNGDYETALRYAAADHNAHGQNDTLVAWIHLSHGDMKQADELFSNVLSKPQGEQRDLQALLGQIKLYELQLDWNRATHKLSSCIVLHAWFVPALAEKAKILVKQGDVGQAIDMAARAVDADPSSIDGLRVLVYTQLANKGRPQVAANRLAELLEALDRREPHNAELYISVASTAASMSGNDHGILQLCMTMIERAISLQPDQSIAVVHQAKLQLLMGDMGMAMATNRRAAAVDQTSVLALQGMVHCHLLDGMIQEAELQMEFLRASQATAGGGEEARMLYLEALIAMKKGGYETSQVSKKLATSRYTRNEISRLWVELTTEIIKS